MRVNGFHQVLAGITLLALAACGGEEQAPQGNNNPPPPTWTNKKPSLLMASPSRMAVGQTLTIYGKDFIARSRGQVVIRFRGTFYDSKGGTEAVDYQAKGTVLNTGKVTWDLWPNVVFSRSGDKLGRFVGSVTVLNHGNDNSYKYSDSLPVAIDVMPSLIPRVARPMNNGCKPLVSGTLENQAMAFAVEAVGLRAGTKDNPLVFYWTFLAKQWQVGFDYGTVTPKPDQAKDGGYVIEDRVTSGAMSTLQDGGPKNFLLKVGSDLFGSKRIKSLKTGKIPSPGNNMPITALVAATDSTGKTVRLSIKITINKKVGIVYNGVQKIARRYPPVRVSGCIPGQDIGRDVSYSEGSHESRSRSVGINWNASVGGNLAPIPSNPFALGLNFSVGFGVNIQDSVSSDKSKSLQLSGHILPGEYGSFYRQTTKWHRVAQLYVNNVCGGQIHVGDAVMSDWTFTPELATGTSCPPPSSLPKAQIFEQDPGNSTSAP